MEKYGISDKKAEELEDFAKQENILEQNKEANNLFKHGKSYYDNVEYKKAIESLLKAVELKPNDAEIWFWLCNSYYGNEQYDKGRAAQLVVGRIDYCSAVGLSYYKDEEYNKAKESFLKAVESDTKNAEN